MRPGCAAIMRPSWRGWPTQPPTGAPRAGTPLEQYFTDAYGGLFRIVAVKPGAIDRLAAQHIHTVDARHADGGARPDQHDGPAARARREIVAAIAAETAADGLHHDPGGDAPDTMTNTTTREPSVSRPKSPSSCT
jgi:hypothetical protein